MTIARVLLSVLILGLLGPNAASAAAPCAGRDLVAWMKQEHPANYQQYRREADAIANHGANLWRVEGRPGTAVSWLYGTMHATDARATRLPAQVAGAIDASRVVALEIAEVADPVAFKAAMAAHASLMALPPGEDIASILSDREERQVEQALSERGIPLAAVSRFQPWVIATMLAIPHCEFVRQESGVLTVDAVIGQRARAAGAELVGLETIPEQFAAFASLAPDLQREYLVETAKLRLRVEDLFETMLLLYLDGRAAETLPLTGALLGETNYGGDEGGFNAVLIDRRNHVMAQRALPLIEKGGAFVAVGALHLSGEEGLVALLRRSGYRVDAQPRAR